MPLPEGFEANQTHSSSRCWACSNLTYCKPDPLRESLLKGCKSNLTSCVPGVRIMRQWWGPYLSSQYCSRATVPQSTYSSPCFSSAQRELRWRTLTCFRLQCGKILVELLPIVPTWNSNSYLFHLAFPISVFFEFRRVWYGFCHSFHSKVTFALLKFQK